jgi:hypothetical protein
MGVILVCIQYTNKQKNKNCILLSYTQTAVPY